VAEPCCRRRGPPGRSARAQRQPANRRPALSGWLLAALDLDKLAEEAFATLTLAPWCGAAFQSALLAPQYRLLDAEALAKAYSETLYAALLRGRQGGWLSPNGAAGVAVGAARR
jgi:hypothetical protein